jgi:hypothetical protein
MQTKGVNYREDDKSAPVITGVSIAIAMVLMVMAGWYSSFTDVEGAFLHGTFQRKNEKVYTSVPQGLRHLYPPTVMLLLLATTYGTIQGALQWFREMTKALMYLQ